MSGSVRFAVLVNGAMLSDGLVSMLGAGWTRVTAAQLPGLAPISVVVQLQGLTAQDVVQVGVLDPNGEELADASTLIAEVGTARDDEPLTTWIVLTIPVQLAVQGRHVVRVHGDIDEPYELDFWVWSAR